VARAAELSYAPERLPRALIIVNAFIAPTSEASRRLAQAFAVGAFELG
jgi:hypothetical protein